MASSKELAPDPRPFFPHQFIRNVRTEPRFPPETLDLSGQVVIVTGPSSGLGAECARQLLSYKVSHLVMAVRSTAKGEAVAAGLRKQHPGAEVSVWQLDMTSYDSVRAFAARAGRELARLDVAILNAGIAFSPFRVVPATGHEETVQVNFLSTMLLAMLLLPVLKAKSPGGQPGRVTISTAMLSITAKFPNKGEDPLLPSFNESRYWGVSDIYATSKLLGQMFLWKLTDRVPADSVVVNMVEPGFIKGTDLHRNRPAAAKVLLGLFKAAAARTVQVGASTYVDAAVVKGRESHGCIIENWEVAPYAPFQYSAEGKAVMERLWKETMEEFSFADAEGILRSL